MRSESDYTARPPCNQWPKALVLGVGLAAGGCGGLSIPLGDPAQTSPAVTGSTRAAWRLPPSLPTGLASSDASAIAQAAGRALAGHGAGPGSDWSNAVGSSGRLVPLSGFDEEDGEICRTYAATITSIRGVHLYLCRACRSLDGRVTVRAIEAAGGPGPATAGI